MKTSRDLRNDLEALGQTEKEVAQMLKEKGIKGRKYSSCNCPVARYLLSLGYSGPSISQELVVACNGNHVAIDCTTPDPVSNFISSFDFGYHPNLVE